MYTATMKYVFAEADFTEGCNLWKWIVLEKAKQAPGLIRMQLLLAPPIALAIGTWKDKKDAEAFMKTGVFKKLTDSLEGKLSSPPQPEIWTLDAYWQA